LPEGPGRVVEVDAREIAVFRRGQRVHALDNVCPQRGSALAAGEVRGEVVYCPLHAWAFELGSGGCPERPQAAVRACRVHVEGGAVELEL
jgi:nitrite reductase (NADH) small subunit